MRSDPLLVQGANIVARILRIFALILAGEMIFGLPFHTQRFFRATFLEAFDITNTQLGDMFAAYGITAMFSYLVGGHFADRYSARSLMAVSLVLTACGGLYMATIPGVRGMSALYAFWGISTTFLFWAALIKATRDWGGATSQGKAFGILDGGRGLATSLFGAVAVAILAVYLPDESASITDPDRKAGLRSIVFFYSSLTLLSAIVVWFLVPHDDDNDNKHRSLFAGVPDVIRNPLIWAQAGVIVCAYCGYKGLDNFSLYAVQALDKSEVDAATLATYGFLVRPVACVVAGLVADRFDTTRTIRTLFVMLVISYSVLAVAAPATTALAIIYANLFVTFFAVFALRAIYYALLEETHTPKHLTGASVAVIAFFGYSPEVFFGPVIGRILDANPGVAGHLNSYAFLAAVAAVGFVVTLILLRINDRKRREAVLLNPRP